MKDRTAVDWGGFLSTLGWRYLAGRPAGARLAHALLFTLSSCWGTSVLGQFDIDALPPPPVLPPPALRPPVLRPSEFRAAEQAHDSFDEPTASDGELQRELRSLQQAIDTLRSRNPQAAAQKLRSVRRMLREQSRNAFLLADRTGTAASNYLHQPPAFKQAAACIQRLKSAAGEEAAEVYETRLEDLRGSLESNRCDFPTGSTPEIHHIFVARGAALPDDLRSAANRLAVGYAEVHVSHTARPVILCLSSREPLIWRLKVAKQARVVGIVLDSVADQKVIGIEGVFVIDSRKAQRQGLVHSGSDQRDRYAAAHKLAGGIPVTHFSTAAWSGLPIELGPADRAWRSAYIAKLVDELIVEVSETLRRRQAEDLPRLRFAATFRQWSNELQPEVYRAEFNLHGPIAATMTPLSDPMLLQSRIVPDVDGPIEFGLTFDARLVTVAGEAHEKRLIPVPLPAGWNQHAARFSGMAFDSKRQRLLSAIRMGRETMLASLDIHRGSWTRLGRIPDAVFGIEYAAESDEVWVLGSDYVDSNQEASVRLLKLDAGGNIVHDVAVSPAVTMPVARGRAADYGARHPAEAMLTSGMSQLVLVDGLAVLIGYRKTDTPDDEVCEIHVIEPNSGNLLYANIANINHGNATYDDAVSSDAQPNRRSLAATCMALDQAEAEIQNLRQSPSRIADATARLKTARALWDGRSEGRNDGPAVSQQPRVYVVGRYSSTQPVRVRVTDRTAPVILIVCGRQAMDWQIEAAEGVELTEIVAAGIASQTISRHPHGTKLRYLAGAEGFFVHDLRHRPAVDRVRRRISLLTGGLDVNAIAAVHQSAGTQIVGPQDGVLRMQLIERELDALQAITKSRADRLKALKSRRFRAMHAGPMPDNQSPAGNDAYWNVFTVTGPLIGHSTAIDSRVQIAAQDADSGLLFLWSQGTLSIKDAKTGHARSIPLRTKFPGLGHVHGMALDDAHDRLFLSTATELRSLELQTMTMSTLRSDVRNAYSALAWSASRRQLYAIEEDRTGRGEIRRIQRFNAHGARLGTIELSQVVTREQSFAAAGLQLIDLDEMLAVIEYRQGRTVRLANGHQLGHPSTGRITVLEVDSGEIVYEAQLKPRLEVRTLSESELLTIWQQMTEPNPRGDVLMWKMAAGGDATLQFLRDRFTARSQPPSRDKLDGWIDDLDHHRFSVREAAFEQLRAAGSVIESFVRERLAAGDVTPEVRERLQVLVANWSLGLPQTTDELRRMRALEVVARIGTDEAVELLQRLQGEGFDPFVRRHARQKLAGDDGHPVPQIPVIQFQRQLFVPRRN